MKLECTADPRAWAEVCDVWTRKLVREFADIVGRDMPLYDSVPKDEDEAKARQAEYAAAVQQRVDDLAAYYRRVVKNAHMVDAEGNELAGLDAILSADMDGVDAAVTNWWAGLPYLAYYERQKMGEAKRVN